jgi:hypothetical protein
LDAWLLGKDWADSCEKMASFNGSTKVVSVTAPGSVFGYAVGQRFYFLNILEELDSPGEYYIDRTNGVLYFWPPTSLGTNAPVLSTLDRLILFSGASYITFTG